MKRIVQTLAIISLVGSAAYAETESRSESTTEPSQTGPQSYAWTIEGPLGDRMRADIDTVMLNYAQRFVPSAWSDAYATTGNYGAEGINMIYFERPSMSPFMFGDVLRNTLPTQDKMKFYNTRMPMTLLSYSTGGGRDVAQDHLNAVFSGNINKQAQVGAFLDYIYSKGSYDYQADNDMSWGFNGSYIGDRFEFQGFYYHYNALNKENGGITDDLYITDPAEIQGGSTSINAKSIPTNLTASHSKVVGGQMLLNARYKLGFWQEHKDQEADSVISRTYVPVTSFIYQLNFNEGKHIFKNTDVRQNTAFWDNTYFNLAETYDRSQFMQVKQTVGIALLEGFNKYAKAGLAAYLTHDFRRYRQTPDSISFTDLVIEGLTPYPFEQRVAPVSINHFVYVGARLTKTQGSILTYGANVEFGLAGGVTGEISADGWVSTRFRMLGDTVGLRAYGSYNDDTPNSFIYRYVSNHFIWNNDMGRTRSVRFGGQLTVPFTGTFIDVGFENTHGTIYFNPQCIATQDHGSVRVLSASLHQNFDFGAFHWHNRLTYQESSNQSVIPLPKLAVYSNLYLLFKVAHVLDVQLGVDCNYYTRYKAPGYQPALMTFYNQDRVECGNYPFMNAYINFKLSRARFFVMMSHVNQGLFGSNYFSSPHYPLNPRRFQMGVSVDFVN